MTSLPLAESASAPAAVPDAPPAFWQIEVTVPQAAVAPLEAALEDQCSALLCFEVDAEAGLWRVQGLCSDKPDTARLGPALALAAAAVGVEEPEPIVVRLESRDWLSETAAAFPPLAIGRFFVHGSHHQDGTPPGTHPLLVDAATAFGSGDHGSTRGCLMALDARLRRHPRRLRRVLDVGCGSGILSLAAARALRTPVTAVDIDPESVRVTRFNARRNGLAAWVRAWPGAGVSGRPARGGAPYDLIFANILARPLTRLARGIAPLLAPGGTLILAGLLRRQEAQVLGAYRMQGLVLAGRLRLGPWSTLILRRRTRGGRA